MTGLDAARGGYVLVAPDKFKGTLSAAEVAHALAQGLRRAGQDVVERPLADGGEGTADALLTALGGTRRQAMVSDPLGRPFVASFALLDDGRAVLDAAQASGLVRLSADELDPWSASTFGTGELVAAAVSAGAEHVVVGVGGTATVDGGQGAIEAVRRAGCSPELTAACDVDTVWEQAAATFGPQKGADEAMVTALEQRLDRLAGSFARDPRGVPLTGCGGGLSGGLWAELGATLVSGSRLVLDAVRIDELLGGSRLVVTGEGRLDAQTAEGKLVKTLADRCAAAGVPCVAVVGRNELDAESVAALGLARVIEAGDPDRLARAGTELGVAVQLGR